jgi:hypothetical protein
MMMMMIRLRRMVSRGMSRQPEAEEREREEAVRVGEVGTEEVEG